MLDIEFIKNLSLVTIVIGALFIIISPVVQKVYDKVMGYIYSEEELFEIADHNIKEEDKIHVRDKSTHNQLVELQFEVRSQKKTLDMLISNVSRLSEEVFHVKHQGDKRVILEVHKEQLNKIKRKLKEF